MSELKIGIGTEPGVSIGPLIDEEACATVQRHVNDAVEKGARIICGEKPLTEKKEGYFFEPLGDVTDDMLIMKE